MYNYHDTKGLHQNNHFQTDPSFLNTTPFIENTIYNEKIEENKTKIKHACMLHVGCRHLTSTTFWSLRPLPAWVILS